MADHHGGEIGFRAELTANGCAYGAAAMKGSMSASTTATPVSAPASLPPADAHRQAWYEDFCERAKGTNVNDKTLLATDYLNHFNEIIMLMELIPDAPECLEDCRAWEPKSYVQHFHDSSIADRDLAIAAYPYSPPEFRGTFDYVVAEMNRLVATALPAIEAAVEKKDDERCRHIVEMSVAGLRALGDRASAAIHGDIHAMDQSEIDRLMEISTASWA